MVDFARGKFFFIIIYSHLFAVIVSDLDYEDIRNNTYLDLDSIISSGLEKLMLDNTTQAVSEYYDCLVLIVAML